MVKYVTDFTQQAERKMRYEGGLQSYNYSTMTITGSPNKQYAPGKNQA